MSPNTRVPATRTKSVRRFTGGTEKLESQGNPARPHREPHPKLSPPPHDYSIHEITNVPAQIPDTQLPSTDTITPVSPSVTSASTSKASSATRERVESKSTFVPLPYLKTQNLTEVEEAARSSSLTHPTSTSRSLVAVASMTGNPSDRSRPSNASHNASSRAVIAITVTSVLVLFVATVLIKLMRRPRRRKTPTPSLPILRDGSFLSDRVESEGSPVFGGKECPSPIFHAQHAKTNSGLWTWTQYNSGPMQKPAPVVTVTRSTSRDQLPPNVNKNTDIQGPKTGQYPFVGHGGSNDLSKSKSATSLQPAQNAITRAVSRLSTVSMSLYPNSPGGYSEAGDVGLALDGIPNEEPTNVTEQRYKDRTIATRNRTSMITPGSAKDAGALRRSQSFAYGGMEPTSPPNVPSRQTNGGRARIKSTYYTPGSYPRTSAAATNYGKRDVDREQNRPRLEQDRVGQAETRQTTRTSVLGVTSPIPGSPQPTLYPEDSMSVIGEAKKVTLSGRNQKKPVPKGGCEWESPPSDGGGLGNLMMVDFAVSKSTASLVNIRPCEAVRAQEAKSKLKKRVEDKPPRVPSPPPIPSLAQMAMQHRDPEGYGDYHSPTYSIYGLYDGGRG